jgi:type 2 lantibiotic biosynthesis protein LanM
MAGSLGVPLAANRDAPLFGQRLASDGLTEDTFRYLLGEPAEALRDRLPSPSAWLAVLLDAFAQPLTGAGNPLPMPPALEELPDFLAALAPLINRARARLHAGVEQLARTGADLPFDPVTVEEVLTAPLSGRLLAMVSRTLILELHVARLQGLLPGSTAAERFESFVERLRRPEVALVLLQEYPVLARQVVQQLDQWVAAALEFLQRLCDDWPAIRATFSPDADAGPLVELDGAAGDQHRDGRTVRIARFASGFRLVYKPRSLHLDRHFQDLLAWLNARGSQPDFRLLTILDRGAYGWVEFVPAEPCASEVAVARFYQRQGAYLALLHALAATDFHSENVIAAGEYPVLVDLEALFHPPLHGTEPAHAGERAIDALASSVLAVGLLPERVWGNAESPGVDISGLGAAEGQMTPNAVLGVEEAGTDAMRIVRRRVPMAGSANRPSLNGADVVVTDYVDAIAVGFAAMYHMLLAQREALLAADGPLAPFAQAETRVILRATQVYARLLQESFHPDVLRDALDRDRLLDRLWTMVAQQPRMARAISAERVALLRGDVPLFTSRPASRDLWGDTDTRIEAFFHECGMDRVRRRLGELSEADCRRQLWFGRGALAMLVPEVAPAPRMVPALPTAQPAVDRAGLLAAAQAIGDRLASLALRGSDDAAWIGLVFLDQRAWSVGSLGIDLNDGLPGVALFLAHLGAISGEERHTALARAALVALRRAAPREGTARQSIGAFGGWGGMIYALVHLGALWQEPALFAEAEAIVARLPALIAKDDQLDIFDGAAGCIAGLLSLYRCAPTPSILAAAVQCGDHLLATAQAVGQGAGWVNARAGARPLAGFSHGAAGIAWALLELAAVSGEARFREAALAGIAYERSLFSPAAGNWPDLRGLGPEDPAHADEAPSYMTAWCHCAPGIGLARLLSLPHLDDAATRAEIDVAVRTTLAQGFGQGHSLCHGDLGNLDFLLQASRLPEHAALRRKVRHLAAATLSSGEANGWICGTPARVESPGLLVGLAGIGYGLLRLAEPARVPSVLALAPPAVTAGRRRTPARASTSRRAPADARASR